MAARRLRLLSQFLLALPLLAFCLPAAALDYNSLGEAAPLFDAPSAKAKPLFVVAAGTPVELVVSLDGWSKVRDSRGDLAWVEKKFLSEKRTLIVRTDRAQIRATAEDKAAVAFEAERDVVLELLETLPGGWARVRHRDGQGGFVKAFQVWGL